MKTFSIAFVILLLIGIFSPSDSLFNFLKYEGNTLFKTQSASLYLPFRACTSEHKETNRLCVTATFDQNQDVRKFFNDEKRVLSTGLNTRGTCLNFHPFTPDDTNDNQVTITRDYRSMCNNIVDECSEGCKRLDYMTFEINKDPIEFLKRSNYPTVKTSDKRWAEQWAFYEESKENYPPDEFNDQILFAKSIWDPANNPDHLAAEIAIRNDIPFWDSWANVEENIIYIAKEYKLTFLLIMSYAGLAFAGAILIFQFAVTVISGMGAKKDGRYKTGFKDNVTTADAVQSVQGPLSALNPIKYAFFIIGTLCYLPFMISIPLLIPGGFAPHLVEVIFFYFVLFFMGGIFLVTFFPIYIIFALYSLAIGEPLPF